MELTPRLTLTDEGGNTLNLWLAQEDIHNVKNNVDVQTIPGNGPSENVVTNLSVEQTIDVSGKVPLRYLAGLSEFSSDYETAAAQWVTKAQSFIGANGAGLQLEDKTYDESSLLCHLARFSWDLDLEDPRLIQWTGELIVGEGILSFVKRSADTSSPGTQATLGGYALPNPMKVSQDVKLETNVEAVPYAETPEENLVIENGTEQSFEVEGRVRVADSPNTFESNIRSLTGDNQSVTYSSAFPGADYNVTIEDFEMQETTDHRNSRHYTIKMIRGGL